MYKYFFNAIMDRYDMKENANPYVVSFYIEGLIGIVNKWIENDCKESISEIIEIIESCMNRK